MRTFLLYLTVAALFGVALSEVKFTGDAKADFLLGSTLTPRDISLRHSFQDTQPMNCGPYMNAQTPRRRSGLDLDAVHVIYDDQNDILYFGAQCAGICGDSDGDGNPSGITGPASELKTDTANMCNNEEMSIMVWDQVPEDYTVRVDDRQFFFPTMVIGVDYATCTTQNSAQGVVSNWNAYEWRDYKDCLWPIPRDDPNNTCVDQQRFYVNDPGSGVYTGRKIHQQYNVPPIVTPFFRPNSTHPHIEWYLRDWKNYPQNDFKPATYDPTGVPMRMGLTTVSASLSDSCGEDRILSEVWSVKWDCNGDPYTTELPLVNFDDCGICGGNNTLCLDCAGIINGTTVHDDCGICGGNNTLCLDCADIINGTTVVDDCGICGGNNTLCLDCAGNINGTIVHDDCGICGGNNTLCLDCAGNINGTTVHDDCGICGGNNTLCLDCAGNINGTTVHDDCGICGGNNTLCLDCAGIVNGTTVHDDCGICGGNNTLCLDCAGIVNGTTVHDDCGICGGNNTICLDCEGVLNGTATYDDYEVCNGGNYHDCENNPYGNKTYDDCHVCGGDGSSCACDDYLGYEPPYLCYALLRWTIAASRVKITDTLDVLYAIKHELPYYNYKSHKLALVDYIDNIHYFCDECLDNFDYAQVWFADRLAGNCVGAHCNELATDNFHWSL